MNIRNKGEKMALFKEIEDTVTDGDWEEVPQEDLWEDGELNTAQVQHKIINRTLQTGDWLLIRRTNNE